MELLNYNSNMFYTNTEIIKDHDNRFIKGKAKDLIEELKYTLPNLYLSYANDNLTMEEIEYIQEIYISIIKELEKIKPNKVVKVCENEAMSNLFVDDYMDLICPQCEHKEINYINYKGTHIYNCDNCKFVGFEMVDVKDKMNMMDWLSKES